MGIILFEYPSLFCILMPPPYSCTSTPRPSSTILLFTPPACLPCCPSSSLSASLPLLIVPSPDPLLALILFVLPHRSCSLLKTLPVHPSCSPSSNAVLVLNTICLEIICVSFISVCCVAYMVTFQMAVTLFLCVNDCPHICLRAALNGYLMGQAVIFLADLRI